MRARATAQTHADALAAKLDLGLDIGICHACLSFVSFALDDGDPREVRRQTKQMTPMLWNEGLEEPALEAVRQACSRSVPGAGAALADLERLGSRSVYARAIVLRLAAELSRVSRAQFRLVESARGRLPLAPPELN